MIVAVDPGIQGGLACLSRPGESWGVRLPYDGNRLDVAALLSLMPPTEQVSLVVLEVLGFRPNQSVQSCKTQCINWGRLRGALEARGYLIVEVTPQTWKAVVLKDTDKDKEAAIKFCELYYPEIDLIPGRCKVPQDGIADAVCIAHWTITKHCANNK